MNKLIGWVVILALANAIALGLCMVAKELGYHSEGMSMMFGSLGGVLSLCILAVLEKSK